METVRSLSSLTGNTTCKSSDKVGIQKHFWQNLKPEKRLAINLYNRWMAGFILNSLLYSPRQKSGLTPWKPKMAKLTWESKWNPSISLAGTGQTPGSQTGPWLWCVREGGRTPPPTPTASPAPGDSSVMTATSGQRRMGWGTAVPRTVIQERLRSAPVMGRSPALATTSFGSSNEIIFHIWNNTYDHSILYLFGCFSLLLFKDDITTKLNVKCVELFHVPILYTILFLDKIYQLYTW